VETVAAAIYGEAAKTYYTIVDFGGYFGKREMLESSEAYISTSSSSSKALINHFYGGSMQADFRLGRGTRLFNEVTILRRSGYYGSNSSGAVKFCDAAGNVVEYKGTLTMHKGPDIHDITLEGSYSSLRNDENTYDITTRPGESSEVVYLGSQQALAKGETSLSLAYNGKFDVSGHLPALEAGASVRFFHKDLTAESYPNYRKQDVSQICANAYAKRNYASGRNYFRPFAEIGLLMGGGTKNDDGKKASATGEAYSGTVYLDRNFEHLTAPRACAKIGFRYTRMAGKGTAVFIEVKDSFSRMLEEPEYLSAPFRNLFCLSVGCDF